MICQRGTLVGTFLCGQRTVTALWADASCGTPVCGNAICGVWWAYACPDGLLLGGEVPVVDVTFGEQIPPAGLRLGAVVPDGAGRLDEIPSAGLKLGAVVPNAYGQIVVSVPDAGLALGATSPGITISSTLSPNPAGLLLGAWLPDQVGSPYLLPEECIDIELAGAACTDLALVGAAVTSIDLDPLECD